MRFTLGFAAFLALVAGCHRAGSTGTTGTTAPAAAAIDLRTFTRTELEGFLQSRYRDDSIVLTGGANGQFQGTRKSPDGTATLPIRVTVQADHAIVEAQAPGGLSLRETVPLQGEIKSDLRERPGS